MLTFQDASHVEPMTTRPTRAKRHALIRVRTACVTNRPIWSDTPLLGLLFIVSAASTSAALMILLAEKSRWTMPGLLDLHRMDAWVIALELIVLIAVMVSLGPVLRAWLNAWGLLLLFGVIGLGMVLPLTLYWRSEKRGDGKSEGEEAFHESG